MVMSFVVRLPFLQALGFVEVMVEELPEDMSIAPPDAHERLEPLNVSLQRLSIEFHYTCKAREMAAVAKYLLMRLPNLTIFSAPDVSAQTVLDFAREYLPFYPHLKNAESVFLGRS
ncbi:hypothetical protein H4R21_002327 [Coemansia helicoidea]|uniref:Uncharacterized protein n=1 Tax=Coemansia helicoidea TaxID=1286919 RepID=A0ACC1L6Z3_9FUNG|nr:hypothetical protein H4R21_002327 [Coemansia helicoidea]